MKRSYLIVSLIILFGCKETGEKRIDSEEKIISASTNCIERIFMTDSIFGAVRNRASEQISMSESISNYTNSLDSMDYTHCPATFKAAFEEHTRAWSQMKNVSDKYPSLRGELHDIFAQLEKSEDSTEFKKLLKGIMDTWKVVEETAE